MGTCREMTGKHRRPCRQVLVTKIGTASAPQVIEVSATALDRFTVLNHGPELVVACKAGVGQVGGRDDRDASPKHVELRVKMTDAAN